MHFTGTPPSLQVAPLTIGLFVPPTGFVCFLPRRNVIFLDMSIEDAAKVVISGGMVTPESQAKLKEFAEQARTGKTRPPMIKPS